MRSNEKGLIQYLVLILVLIGLGVGVYLVQKQTSLKSHASIEGAEESISLVGYLDEANGVSKVSDNPQITVPAGGRFFVDVLVKANKTEVFGVEAKLTTPANLVTGTTEGIKLKNGNLVKNAHPANFAADGSITISADTGSTAFSNNVGEAEKVAQIELHVKDNATNGQEGRIDFLEADTKLFNQDGASLPQVIKRSILVKVGQPAQPDNAPKESITYNLSAGWNAIGIPVNPSITPAQLLAATDGKCTWVQTFNDNDGQLKVFNTEPGKEILNSLTTINSSQAYLIKCASATSFVLTGPAVTAMPTLIATNTNWVSLPKGRTISALEFLSTVSTSSLRCIDVARYDGATDHWTTHQSITSDNDFQMNDKEGYVVKCVSVQQASGNAVSYNLVANWNLIGLPVTPSQSISPDRFLSEVTQAKCDSILSFDSAIGQARAYFSDPSKRILNSLTGDLKSGTGYNIHCTQPVSFSVDGNSLASNPAVQTNGWNLISPKKGITAKAQDFLSSFSPSNCDKILRQVPGVQQSADASSNSNVQAYDSSSSDAARKVNFDIQDTEGYWVHCAAVSSTPAASSQSNINFDVNGDGTVDRGDLIYVASRIGKSGAAIGKADLNGDGAVTGTGDYLIMRNKLMELGVLLRQ